MNSVELVLEGCAPQPLAGYLKALGILRLVARQTDPGARGAWVNESFVVTSSLDRTRLTDFFLNRYVPTPVIAPWNGGSGFFPKGEGDKKRAAVEAILNTNSDRFAVYRDSIRIAESLKNGAGLREQPQGEAKEKFLASCRAELPDEAVEFLDATIVMTSTQLRFPPLMGTGGTDGNLEFTNNFMQRLGDLFDLVTGHPSHASEGWLKSALFGEVRGGLLRAAVGQFSPGGVGGPNGRAGFDVESLVNPWDFVLMIEGCLVFATAATKRLEVSRSSVLSYPFTVRASAVGHGGVSQVDEQPSVTRAEMWLPLWNQPMSYREVSHIFQEGRAQVGARPARNGLDFARACASLAVDRGISGFQRFSFLQRSGKSYLAVPLTRFRVRRRVEADLLDDLEQARFVDSLSRAVTKSEVPHALVQAHHQIQEATFQLCLHGGRRRVQDLILALGEVERLLAKRPRIREDSIRSPLVLRSSEWLEQADDGSVEFWLAASIASWSAPGLPHIRSYFSPVREGDGRAWADVESPRVVWHGADVAENLTSLLERRMLDSERPDRMNDEKTERSAAITRQMDKPFEGLVPASLSDVLSFIRGEVDERRLNGLLWGFMALAAGGAIAAWKPRRRELDEGPVPWAYATVKLVATPLQTMRRMDEHFASMPFPKRLLATLATDTSRSVANASEIAERRLIGSGFQLRHRGVSSPGVSGSRVAAAIAFPISESSTHRLVRQVVRPGPVGEDRQGVPTLIQQRSEN